MKHETASFLLILGMVIAGVALTTSTVSCSTYKKNGNLVHSFLGIPYSSKPILTPEEKKDVEEKEAAKIKKEEKDKFKNSILRPIRWINWVSAGAFFIALVAAVAIQNPLITKKCAHAMTAFASSYGVSLGILVVLSQLLKPWILWIITGVVVVAIGGYLAYKADGWGLISWVKAKRTKSE